MSASKGFQEEIQCRLGDGATEEDAIRACQWLSKRKHICPCDGAGDVRAYLASLDGDTVWEEMLAAVGAME